MSTRANIIIKSGRDKLIFYKHSDGYPEGTLPILNQFLDKVKSGEIRDNVGQSAGWLIMLGRENLIKDCGGKMPEYYSWKVGSIEPDTCISSDIEYKYTIDLDKKTITVKQV